MAITYTFSDVMNAAQRTFSRQVESDAAAFVCNIFMNEIWNKYDWRESLTVLPPFYLIPNEQDHGTPAVAVPSDFLGLRQAYLTRLTSTPVYRVPLTVLKNLNLTTLYGPPGQIGFDSGKQSFRVFPRVPANMGSPEWCIQGDYKKRPTKITAANLSSTLLPFDDLYLSNMIEVFKWAAWQMAGDQRAGGVQVNSSGNAVFTGQYANAQEAIYKMAENEGFELGDVNIAPREPLAVTSQNMTGNPYVRIFGY